MLCHTPSARELIERERGSKRGRGIEREKEIKREKDRKTLHEESRVEAKIQL